MGYLLDSSQTLSYAEVKPLIQYLKTHGIIQFLLIFKKYKDFIQQHVKWGDETEFHLVNIDPETKIPRLQINNKYIFDSLNTEIFTLQPEYGSWMLEAVPTQPYDFTGDPNILLQSFRARREVIRSLCREGDVLFTGVSFPLLKVGDCYVPKQKNISDVSKNDTDDTSEEERKDSGSVHEQDSGQLVISRSSFDDELINSHPRYPTMCESIKQRRQEDVCILIPIFPDERTATNATDDEPYPGFIHMDETIFGTGNTSIQVTFGTKNIDEARYLTDQLAVLSSIMLPLSAASAVFKGKLANLDTRWTLISQSLDCRTKEERDPTHPNYVAKARWSSISQYLSDRPQCKEEYNDIQYPLDQEMMEFAKLTAKDLDVDIDEKMIRHLGFLFAQDPLIVFSDKVYVDDTKNTNHFENFQSTNWTHVRFKPPQSFDSEIGWLVELRTMEAQLTAEESVAFSMFSYFFALMVMKREYNFYIPISKMDENMVKGEKKDAILTEKFWFRKDIQKDSADEWVELTIDEILHGKPNVFVGLFNLIYAFCKEEYGVDIQAEWIAKKENADVEINKLTENMRYFEILSKRARGEIPTIARWIRTFVLKHPKYQKDSVVSTEIAAELVQAMVAISNNEKTYADFL